MGKELQPMDISAPGQNLEAYLNSIQNIAILSPEEERKLAEDLYYREDLEAARQLVMAHLRFVVHIARGYSGYGLPQADLIQEGNVGLMKAVDRFDPNRGVKVVSFAVHLNFFLFVRLLYKLDLIFEKINFLFCLKMIRALKGKNP